MVVDVGLALMLALEVLVGDVGVPESGMVVGVLVLGVEVVEAPRQPVVVVGDVEMAVGVYERVVLVVLGFGSRLEMVGHGRRLTHAVHIAADSTLSGFRLTGLRTPERGG